MSDWLVADPIRTDQNRLFAPQLLDVYDLLPFDNPDGGAWKQGFQISYRGDEWAEQPLELFLVPHSHNDPGEWAEPGLQVEPEVCEVTDCSVFQAG